MNQYVCENEISRDDFDRINELMYVRFEEFESIPEMRKLIYDLDARPYTTPYSFYFEFDDNSKIYIDICSGSSNYYDDCVWESSNGKDNYVFDCFYEIAEENEFIYNNTRYICKFIIKEN